MKAESWGEAPSLLTAPFLVQARSKEEGLVGSGEEAQGWSWRKCQQGLLCQDDLHPDGDPRHRVEGQVGVPRAERSGWPVSHRKRRGAGFSLMVPGSPGGK